MNARSVGKFAHLWERAVKQHGERPFLVFREGNESCSDTTWTYASFDELVARAAGRLQELGVGRGDAVHVCLRNSPAFLLVWLAAARLGAWMVPVDPASTAGDIENQTRRTAPKVGICAASRSHVYRRGAGGYVAAVIEVTETAADAHVRSPLLGRPVDKVPGEPVRPEDRLAIMFTSGTTSEPKGVVLTQANYHYIGVTMAALAQHQPRDRWYVCLPLFHGNAQYYCFSAAIAAGASVALASRFTASGWPFHVHEMGATHVSLFAAPIRMILARRRRDAPKLCLQHAWFAQSLAETHYQEFTDLCGIAPRQIYGMTETTAIVTADLGERPSHDTIGTVIPGREVILLDRFSLRPVPDGVPGVITIAGERGVDLFLEYLDNPAANATAFPMVEEHRTWFSTGDLALREADGRLRFVGRIDDVVKVAGENVSLTEVEAALAQAPGVLEVAVLAVDDPVRDKVPVAYVVARDLSNPPTIEELSGWAENNLPRASRPQAWNFIDTLPRTSVGKIKRFKLG